MNDTKTTKSPFPAARTLVAALALTFLASCATGNSGAHTAPAPLGVTLDGFKLSGDLGGDHAAFTLTATARVGGAKGGTLDLLSGPVALTALQANPREHVRAEQNHFILSFDRPGDYPVVIKFSAAVKQSDGWNALDFHVASSVLQPVILTGLSADTQFQFPGAARPDRDGSNFVSYLPADGSVRFAWKEVRPETEGKLFFSAEMLSQISIGPGQMRQSAILNFKVMQGELNRVSMLLTGAGEVARVQGDQVLSWSVEAVTNSTDRRLVVQLNQPQKDQFTLLLQTQTPLGAFPQTADVIQIRPENATRFAGCFRIVNDGAVRLEVATASGMSQISPDQFPDTAQTREAFRAEGSQRFAYRFASETYSLRIRGDQIQPELSVSEVLAYHNGENEMTIDAELELDIRESPLRELVLNVPKGYAIARLDAPSLSDYFLSEPADQGTAQLRLVLGQPLSGRQLVSLRLEHNQGLGATNWNLPRIDVTKAKSVRGYVGVSSDAGFRITAERTDGLTDIATPYFPARLPGIQTAFRMNADAAWEAAMRIERLPQTIQADVLHLFSIGEGIAYGSSVINYVVSGAPVAVFRVELADEYSNVEFTGKDIRTWQKTNGGYIVQLQTAVSGPYTLLATYVRPFKPQGEILNFTGARPLDTQNEQGYTLVISADQFQVKPTEVSPGLLALETGEVPPEYRMLFDAPILAAYRYSSRPFSLSLSLSPLEQGASLSQIVERASLITRISKEGQVLTDVRYFMKNRGNPHLRLTIPQGTQLWSATLNGAQVVPVNDGKDSLIPLPQSQDPNAVLELQLKLASESSDSNRVSVNAPLIDAPVMLSEWKIEPDAGQRLVYRDGTLAPEGAAVDVSGFAQLARLFAQDASRTALTTLLVSLGFLAVGVLVWRWASAEGVYRASPRHVLGLVLGLLAFVMVFRGFWQLHGMAGHAEVSPPGDITFLAPVQQAGSALRVELASVSAATPVSNITERAWPALLAAGLALAGWIASGRVVKYVFQVAAWTLLAWAAARLPNGAGFLFWIMVLFLLRLMGPLLMRLFSLPPPPRPARVEPSAGPAPVTVALLAAGFLGLGFLAPVARAADIPDSVTHSIRIEDKFAIATATIHWQATKGQTLPLLSTPAVLTHVLYPTNKMDLAQGPPSSNFPQVLVAREAGAYDIEVQYELRVGINGGQSGFTLPVPYGLINQVKLTVVNSDVDVLSPGAVSIQTDHSTTNTVASLVLSPADAWIIWKPRTRDVRSEKPVFYVEIAQLYVPSAGVIEGAHTISIKPAKGELSELTMTVPTGATVTDVIDPSQGRSGAGYNFAGDGVNRPVNPAGSIVSLWRFDPDTRKLRVTLNPPQSKPFKLVVQSQIATGPLPFDQAVGLLGVDNAATQLGLLGIATGNEVQLDTVTAPAFSQINLEDFPADGGGGLQNRIAGLTLRRAFSYSDPNATATLKAVAVEPDVRVETQDTLSLGEARTVLNDTFTADITRAGIFSLSFVMPEGFDVESISGQALSHWTELKTDAGRVITLHLSTKTEGQQPFAITLAGSGVKTAGGWKVPQVIVREADKQRGTLLIVPEQGMQLRAVAREGYMQLDPQKSGITQKGVLAFSVLQLPSNLTLDIEQVDPWVQVTSLQHASVSEAQVKVAANLQYQIENTGLNSFRVFVPTNAEGVRFQGAQVADFLQVTNTAENGLQEWDVKLRQRVIGQYLLQLSYDIITPGQATEVTLRGVRAAGVNLQRGFVTVQSDPRLQVSVDRVPETLQPTEFQSIPRALQKDLQAAGASFTYRLVEPAFELALKLQRHEAAKLLPARVNSVTFDSVVSDDGVMLTRARLEMLPGDKRLLGLKLPKDARFWFAFVNDNGAWPWISQDNILIPLEQQSRGGRPVPVEIFYSCQTGATGPGSLDLDMLAPQFDLPMENITWRVSLSDKWRIQHWTGSFQLAGEQTVPRTSAVDAQSYLQNENNLQMARTREAEDFMTLGNVSLQNGDPQQARRAFQSAYGLSSSDAAFNEDARVQLHNVRLQQALIGLNARQSAAAGDPGALGGKLRDLRSRKEMNYTQQDAKDIIDNNTADDNATFMRLAEKILQQQDAAVNNPVVIRASIPEQSRLLTFKRAVAVKPMADLRIGVETAITQTAPSRTRIVILACALVVFAIFGFALRARRTEQPA